MIETDAFVFYDDLFDDGFVVGGQDSGRVLVGQGGDAVFGLGLGLGDEVLRGLVAAGH